MSLEILGQDQTGDSLWIRFREEDVIDVTPADLALARRSIQRGYSARIRGHWLDESQVTTLIRAMDAPQPYWPPLVCRVPGCGTEAQTRIDGDLYCGPHGRFVEVES